MPNRVLKPFSGCKPLGVLLGATVVISAVLIAFAAVGLHAFTPSDLLQEYNDGVTSWQERVDGTFTDQTFVACLKGSVTSCTQLFSASNEEGLPPSGEYIEYTPLFYQTSPQPRLLDRNFSFTCNKNSPVLQLELHFQNEQGDLLSFSPQPDPFPVFSYQWTPYETKLECDAALGLFWNQEVAENRTKPYCVLVFIIEDICITVNQTTGSDWGVAPFVISHSAGCRPYPTVSTGCGSPLHRWSYGSYTLIDGTTLDPAGLHRTPHLTDAGHGKLAPLSLPSDPNWVANLTTVGLTLRYVYDPRINAESATNGTLSLETWLNSGTYAFNGALQGFFGLSMLIIGLTLGLVSLLTAFTVAVFFPRVRYNHLYRAVHPDNPHTGRRSRLDSTMSRGGPPGSGTVSPVPSPVAQSGASGATLPQHHRHSESPRAASEVPVS